MSGTPESSTDDLKGLKQSVLVYGAVMALKLSAYAATHVMALLAEGLHTLSDIFVSGFLLIAALWSRREPDDVYMFGYARAQYVGALVAATLFVSFTSFELFREAITGLLQGNRASPHEHVDVAIGVLCLSMAVGFIPLVTLWRQKVRGPAARAQFLELLNDELGLLAALGGTVLVQFGVDHADPVAALVVATIIAVNGIRLFRENLSFLLGRAPAPERMAEVERRVLATPGVLGVHRLRGQQLGPDSLHLDMHIEVARGIPVEQADTIAHAVEHSLESVAPRGGLFVSVHVDPQQTRREVA